MKRSRVILSTDGGLTHHRRTPQRGAWSRTHTQTVPGTSPQLFWVRSRSIKTLWFVSRRLMENSDKQKILNRDLICTFWCLLTLFLVLEWGRGGLSAGISTARSHVVPHPSGLEPDPHSQNMSPRLTNDSRHPGGPLAR